MAPKEPTGVYKCEGGSGWAAFDKDGRPWRVSKEDAQLINKKLTDPPQERNSDAT